MKAIVVKTAGEPDVLEFIDVEKPIPTSGEVLVRTEVVHVGAADVMFRRGLYPGMPALPAVAGFKCGGVIEALGEAVDGLEVGQQVVVFQRGSCAEFVTVPSAMVTPVRVCGNFAEVIVAAFDYSVAHYVLHEAGGLRTGQRVLVKGAAGGIGYCVTELAALAGCEVVALVSSLEKKEMVSSLGATHVILGDDAEIDEQLQHVLQDKRIDLIADGVAGKQFANNFGLLAPFGKVVLYGAAGGLPEDIATLIFSNFFNSPSLVAMSEMTMLNHRLKQAKKVQSDMVEALHSGEIHPKIHMSLPFRKAPQAHELIERRKVLGRIVLTT